MFFIFSMVGFFTKKSLFNLIPLLLSLAFLVIHVTLRENIIGAFKYNMLIDFISIIISIALYIYVDDIEARREVISEVFENRYKNGRKKWEL